MKQTLMWLSVILFMLVWVSYKEARFEERLKENNKYYEHRLDSVISDAADMEREIEQHKLHRSRPFQDDMNSQEFLKILADYLAQDGRCEVKIHKVDWSTWTK